MNSSEVATPDHPLLQGMDKRRRSKIKVIEGGCWLWVGALTNRGYPTKHLHRAVYRQLTGSFDESMELDHLCRVVRCVNPDHLEPVTREENMRRRYALYTHCKSGHEFTPDNTYVMPSGHRSCRTCRNAAAARYQARSKAGDR